MRKKSGEGSGEVTGHDSIQEFLTQQQPDSDSESENEETDKDKDFTCKDKFSKKTETVLVELPRDILNSPEVVSMLDRTGTSTRKAVGVVSSILKTGKRAGQQVDLSESSLSSAGLAKKRDNNRTALMQK